MVNSGLWANAFSRPSDDAGRLSKHEKGGEGKWRAGGGKRAPLLPLLTLGLFPAAGRTDQNSQEGSTPFIEKALLVPK